MAGQPQQQMTPEQAAELKKKLESMSPEQIQEMVRQQCIFCKIISGEVQAFKVYEDEQVIAFLDIQPAVTGHVVVIPKKHYSVLPQMPDAESGYLFSVAKHLAGVVFETVGAQGVTLMQNNGAVAGQTVPHVRVDIIPRFPEDELNLSWKPQQMDEQQFTSIQAAISAKTKSLKITKIEVPTPTVAKVQEPVDKPKPKRTKKPKEDKTEIRLLKP